VVNFVLKLRFLADKIAKVAICRRNFCKAAALEKQTFLEN
jgi:hypothetical protein